MNKDSVKKVRDRDVCCGCGICAAVCPKDAIEIKTGDSGKNEPQIGERCISCGLCLELCPKRELALELSEGETGFKNAVFDSGNCIECQLVQSKNEEILLSSTSGGFITTLVKGLLDNGEYDAAFLTDGYDYSRMLQTKRIRPGERLTGTQKSRYVQIAHTQELAYILTNRDERLILVGTPCYFHGFLKVVEKYKLNRDNYLLIGLFCDKTMTVHVWEYFDKIFAGEALESLHFRDKNEAGWPGDVRIFMKDGEERKISRRERMDVKEYFMPESCLYCMDKLNMQADFSVGDNYVSGKSGGNGSNSLIIRTQRAAGIWEHYKELFEYEQCSFGDIAKSQKMNNRLKDLKKNKQQRLERIHMGENRQYSQIREDVLKRRKNSGFLRKLLSKGRKIFRF